MPESIELHDSELLAVTIADGSVRLRIHAYIHRFPERPGETGSGWTQEVDFVFASAVLEETLPELPCELSHGGITGAMSLNNLIPLPCDMEGELQFTAIDLRGNRLLIHAAAVSIERCGEPTFVEVTPASLYQ
jgi:hypothetical protein